MDVALMVALLTATIVAMFLFPQWYGTPSPGIDNLISCLGFIFVLKGAVLRMAARGHKKHFSKNSEALVMSGPYQMVRNPMYFGTFLVGLGFVLIVWPLWLVPLFVILFYLRFIKEIKKEEQFLKEKFGAQYDDYCRRVPRLMPHPLSVIKHKMNEIFNMEEIFSTKESRGWWSWPIVALLLAILKQTVIVHDVNLIPTVMMFMITYLLFVFIFITLEIIGRARSHG
jgi:protein-S-isoprenylcysteine O-methyltransferase Ste14